MLCYLQMFIVLTSLLLCFGEKFANGEAGHEQEEIGMEKRMLSYADLMNNFGGPNALDLAGQGNSLLIDDERPKRENYNNEDVHIMTLWKRSPSYGRSFFSTTGDLTKKDDFIAPGVLRFGKRMPGECSVLAKDKLKRVEQSPACSDSAKECPKFYDLENRSLIPKKTN
uniref:Uncharacterized protein n=1 Tax=Meloidogyne hapla TaxID=6305 RepID=A0A1I8BQI1_MELHA